jgi:hypothetical protein
MITPIYRTNTKNSTITKRTTRDFLTSCTKTGVMRLCLYPVTVAKGDNFRIMIIMSAPLN